MGDIKVTLVGTNDIKGKAGKSYSFEITDKDGKVIGKAKVSDPDFDGPCGQDGYEGEGTITTSIFDEMIKQIGKGYKPADGLNENPTGEKYEDLDPKKGLIKGHKYSLGSVAKALDYGKSSSSSVSSSSIANYFNNPFMQSGGFPMMFNNGPTSFPSMNVDYNSLNTIMSQGSNLFAGLSIGSYMDDMGLPPFAMQSAVGDIFNKILKCFTVNNTVSSTQNSTLVTNDSISSNETKNKVITENTNIKNEEKISKITGSVYHKDEEVTELGDGRKMKEYRDDKGNLIREFYDKNNKLQSKYRIDEKGAYHPIINEEVDEEVNEEADDEVDEALDEEAHDICKMIYNATDGAGTDDEKLEEAINKIKEQPEVVLRVMEVWKESFAKKANGKSLIQVINGDTEHDPSWSWLTGIGVALTLPKDNQEYILPIKEAMLAKAKDMKINLNKKERNNFNNAIDDFDMGVDDQYKTRNRWGGLIGGWKQDGEKINKAFENMYTAMENQKNKKGKTTKKETTEKTE